jgi:purine-binding chemotaxis protein CheW
MAQNKIKNSHVTNQQDALTVYLQDLLSDEEGLADNHEAVDAGPVADDPNPAGELEPLSSKTVPTLLLPSPEAVPDSETAVTSGVNTRPLDELLHTSPAVPLKPVLFPQSFLTDCDTETISVPEQSAGQPPAEPEQAEPESASVIPPWGQSRFQCLTFSVGDFSFAAPLEKLNGIIEWPEHLTALPGHAPWFLGLCRNRGQNVQVIDLAAVLQCGQSDSETTGHTRYIMLVDEGRLGFVSDTVANMLTLEPQDVKWRADPNQRALVTGTVVDQMCSILDVDALIEYIQQR